MKILVIEDNADILDLLEIILVDNGYEVVTCTDGSFVNNLNSINPSLILLDERLPTARGSELCRSIKANAESKHIPVVLFSAAQGVEQVAAECGADAFVAKPFDIAHLTELIDNLIG